MRCDNCGWQNNDGVTACAKCGNTLGGGGRQADITHNVPVPGQQGPAPNIAGTIKGGHSDAPAWDSPASDAATQLGQQMGECPHCKYPVLADAVNCPNCHKAIGKQAPPPINPVVHPPIGGFKSTIDPYRKQQAFGCRLLVQTREGEPTREPIDLMGNEIALNREVLDPNNPTITSQVQAVLVYRDGVWYIEDRSSQQTTFVRAGQSVPLRKGDVILMGDRKFTFEQ